MFIHFIPIFGKNFGYIEEHLRTLNVHGTAAINQQREKCFFFFAFPHIFPSISCFILWKFLMLWVLNESQIYWNVLVFGCKYTKCILKIFQNFHPRHTSFFLLIYGDIIFILFCSHYSRWIPSARFASVFLVDCAWIWMFNCFCLLCGVVWSWLCVNIWVVARWVPPVL